MDDEKEEKKKVLFLNHNPQFPKPTDEWTLKGLMEQPNQLLTLKWFSLYPIIDLVSIDVACDVGKHPSDMYLSARDGGCHHVMYIHISIGKTCNIKVLMNEFVFN